MTELDDKIQIIKKLKNDLYISLQYSENLKIMLKEETEKLEKICTHDYIAESTGDCHKSGYYYTCVICNNCSSRRPEKYRFN